jgi:uncharacterized membrane protein YoaK (UPF0700 family)
VPTSGSYAAVSGPRPGAGIAPAARRLSPAAVRDLLLAGLTVSSGAIDAISFLALGKIFTAFMTGNLVFLGLGVADASQSDLSRVLIALAGFAAGVFMATRIVEASRDSGVWPRGVTVALGVTLMLQAAFLALWVATNGLPGSGSGDVMTAIMALAMGLQSGAILTLGVRGVFTTAATATAIFLFRDLAAPSGSATVERARLAGELGALVAGATAGALLLVHARTYVPVLPLVTTALVIATASISLHGRTGAGPAKLEPSRAIRAGETG